MSNKTFSIRAISKLLPYAVGKKKAYEEIESISININFVDTTDEE
jgi:hypothetical protein